MAEVTAPTEGDIAAAWRQAESDGASGRKLAVTGAALSNDEAEMERNRALLGQKSPGEIDPRRAFRAPPGLVTPEAAPPPSAVEASDPEPDRPVTSADMQDLYVPPHERSKRQAAEAQVVHAPNPVEQQPAPAATVEAAESLGVEVDEEGLKLEREILGGKTGPEDEIGELPDVEVQIGDRKVSMGRIREWHQAHTERNKWRSELQQQMDAQKAAFRQVVTEAQRGLLSDPVGSLRRMGATDEQIREAFARTGFAPAAATPSPSVVPTLGEDADPVTRALAAQTEELRRTVANQAGVISEMYESVEQERRSRAQVEAERARAALLSGVKSDLVATASKMPSMIDPASRKLTPAAKVLVDATMLRVEREVERQIPDHATARGRALEMFGAQAREAGITPKAEQARRAIEGKKQLVPTRPGATPAMRAPPGAPAQSRPNPTAFDWTNDDERRRAMRAAAAAMEAEGLA